MGDGAELLDWHMSKYEAEHNAAWQYMHDGIWVTREGNEIHVEHMRGKHILNCIKMLKRNPSELNDTWIERFKHELTRRKVIRDGL